MCTFWIEAFCIKHLKQCTKLPQITVYKKPINYTHCSSYFQIQTSDAKNCLLHTVKSISGGGFTPDPIGGSSQRSSDP